MLVLIKKVDIATGIIECDSVYGRVIGTWCSEPLPSLNRDYYIEVDIPQVIASKDITISDKEYCTISMQQQSVLVSGLVIDQEDYSLAIRIGLDILLVAVDFTARERSLLHQKVDLLAAQLDLYDTYTNT